MNVVLIDDEQIALDFFQLQLKRMSDVNVIGAYVNLEEGMRTILAKNVDVVFLDIHMPGEDGVSFARRILKEKPEIIIVFVTAFEQYAVHAFEIKALDYLVKPVRTKRLEQTIRRIEETLDLATNEERQVEKEVFRVQLCKQFSYKTTDDKAPKIRWRTARVKELFLLLLQNRETTVYKAEIAELIWPEVDVEKANAQLYTTVYHIRRAIEKFGDHFRIESTTNGYVLYTRNVETDIEVWEKAIKDLPPLSKQTIPSYETAMKYYSDTYLKDHSYVWAISEAERLDRKWIQLAIKIAKQHENERQFMEAFDWYNYICARYPDVEEAHFAVMKHFAQEGKSAYVDYQYQTLTKALDEELGVKPSVYVTKWFNEWRTQIQAGGTSKKSVGQKNEDE